MKSFKKIFLLGALAIPLAHSEGISASGRFSWLPKTGAVQAKVSQAWQNYIKPAGSWTLTSRPIKGVGAFISAGAISAASGVVAGGLTTGLSYVATRHSAVSQCVGAGVGSLVAIWFLNEFGKIIADASYAKMNGEKLSDRYTKELEKIEKLWNSTLSYLAYVKAQVCKKIANNSAPQVHATGLATQVTVIAPNLQQKNTALVDKRVSIEIGLIERLNAVFNTSEKRYNSYKFKSTLPNILAEDLSTIVRVDPYAEVRPWYRVDRFFSGITDYMVEMPSTDSCFSDLDSKLVGACDVLAKSAASDAVSVEKTEKVVHIAHQIIVLLEQKLNDLNTQAYRIKKARDWAQSLGL